MWKKYEVELRIPHFTGFVPKGEDYRGFYEDEQGLYIKSIYIKAYMKDLARRLGKARLRSRVGELVIEPSKLYFGKSQADGRDFITHRTLTFHPSGCKTKDICIAHDYVENQSIKFYVEGNVDGATLQQMFEAGERSMVGVVREINN